MVWSLWPSICKLALASLDLSVNTESNKASAAICNIDMVLNVVLSGVLARTLIWC